MANFAQYTRELFPTNSFNKFITIISGRNFFIVSLMLLVISYFFIDRAVAFYFQPHDSWLYNMALWISPFGYPYYYMALFLVLTLIGYSFFSHTRLGVSSLFILLALLLTAIAQSILKIIFGKARPELLFEQEQFGFYFLQNTNDFWSLPSSLITTATALFFSLAFLFPRYWLWLVLVTLLLSFTRLVATKHYVFDVVASLYIMFMIVIWLAAFFEKRHWLTRKTRSCF